MRSYSYSTCAQERDEHEEDGEVGMEIEHMKTANINIIDHADCNNDANKRAKRSVD